ncbi:MAG: zeta toxin family protein [Bacteroidales bacterium]|nr:zeta toxin family protein [Bacteroidales bacterium]
MQRRFFPFRLRRHTSEGRKGQPKLYIISGCNGSGKTTASYTLLPEILDCREFVNSDEFAKAFSPFSPGSASIQASRYMVLKIRYLLERKSDFAIETTLATRSLKKIVTQAQELGYFVTVLYFWLDSPELAVARVKARVEAGGHDVPEETIRRRYKLGLQYFFFDYSPIADRWILADNTEIPFKVIAQGWKKHMVVKDNIKYESIVSQAMHDNKDDSQQ